MKDSVAFIIGTEKFDRHFLAKPLNDDEDLFASGLSGICSAFQAGYANYKLASDSQPGLMSPKAGDNFMGHWPAGGTQKQVYHFS